MVAGAGGRGGLGRGALTQLDIDQWFPKQLAWASWATAPGPGWGSPIWLDSVSFSLSVNVL